MQQQQREDATFLVLCFVAGFLFGIVCGIVSHYV